jgi:hypothetical protein
MNQYRCETCKNIDCWYHPSKSDINQYGCNNSAWVHSRGYGCASHSDFQSERVLDELMEYINEMYPVPPETGDYLYPSRKGRREVYDQLRGKIKELRQQAGEP